MSRRIPVYVVVPPRTLLLDIAGPIEVLRWTNHVQEAVRFEVSYIGPATQVASSIGLKLTEVAPLPDVLPDDAMIVLAGNVSEPLGASGSGLEDDNAAESKIVRWLKTTFRSEHTLVSICSGALLAGRAGLLDGRACTTHHSACTKLASDAPLARVLENRIFVEDGRCFSSAGVTAGTDLMLHLVSQITDHCCAAEIARYLVVYMRRSGADPQLSPWLECRNHIHPAVHRVQDAIAADPARSWTLKALARIAGASPRHLSRLFHECAGMNIPDYRNRLRVALARDLLAQTQLDMEQVAERAGFASTRQLRRVWGRLHMTSPREAREARLSNHTATEKAIRRTQ
jgi:transcriptional regulator GlxA family with amidase domain